MPRPELEPLAATAGFLRSLLNDLVFVGGAGPPRTTLDVNAIAQISSYAEYAAFGERLRAVGFSEDTSEGAPITLSRRLSASRVATSGC